MTRERALEIARQLTREDCASSERRMAETLVNALGIAGAFDPPDVCTKDQAFEIARLCALSGGRQYWNEPEFERAWRRTVAPHAYLAAAVTNWNAGPDKVSQADYEALVCVGYVIGSKVTPAGREAGLK